MKVTLLRQIIREEVKKSIAENQSNFEVKNPGYYEQILKISNGISASTAKYFQDVINSVKKQNGQATEKQWRILQRLKTGDFNLSTKNESLKPINTVKEIVVNNPQGLSSEELEALGLESIYNTIKESNILKNSNLLPLFTKKLISIIWNEYVDRFQEDDREMAGEEGNYKAPETKEEMMLNPTMYTADMAYYTTCEYLTPYLIKFLKENKWKYVEDTIFENENGEEVDFFDEIGADIYDTSPREMAWERMSIAFDEEIFENQPAISPDIKEPAIKPDIKPKRRTLAPPEEAPNTRPKAKVKEDENNIIKNIAQRFSKLKND